ncbi:hypothetical protein Y032_0039g148 [Ancylostoma ceylanicum]|nr:hypothetical protein Y032_0039g148 [Ancylostoma ceylanicum]
MRTLSKRELRSKNEPRVSSTPPELGSDFHSIYKIWCDGTELACEIREDFVECHIYSIPTETLQKRAHVFFDPSMTSQSGRVLLITANVGSLFEQDQRLQEAWLKTFTERINQEMADIVVIHMQETGGKQLVIPCTL